MDINRLIKSVKMDIGLILDSLPGVKDSTQYIMDILDTKTLPSFDIVYPYFLKKVIHREAMVQIPGPEESPEVQFRIPSKLVDGLDILSVRHMRPIGKSHSGFGCNYTSGYNRFGRSCVSSLYETAWATNIAYADAQLAGLFTESLTPKFYPPNIISINRRYAEVEMFEIEFCVKNDPSLMQLPDTVFQAFKDLLLLDVQTTIYNQYKLFENVETPVGSLNLMISEWSGAQDKREDLYQRYREKATYRTGRIVAG